MSFFSKLFGAKKNVVPSTLVVTVEKSWHYAGAGDCPDPHPLSRVEMPGYVSSDAFGFYNLGLYIVTGHVINPNTGRNNKKTMKSYALSVNDAEKVALDAGVLPPLSVEISNILNEPPNEFQIANAREYGILIPSGAVDADVRAMIERGKDCSPTPDFAIFCTQCRIPFSLYIGEVDLCRRAFSGLAMRDRVALYAHAVFCKSSGLRLGSPLNDPISYKFADSADAKIVKEIEERRYTDLPSPRKGTNVWNTICSYYGISKKG